MRIFKTLLVATCILIVTDSFASNHPKCFKRKRILVVYSFMGKLADSYVKIRRGNNFQMYTRIFGITMSEMCKGRYTQSGDTLYFRFCDGVLPDYASHCAVLSHDGKVLTFLDDVSMSEKQRFTISKDKRKNKTAL
ncbi:MAG: hypothetical protein DI535_14110 [Citrobacter freundii]|nr:MAG: hypothetical protein DI535_14110 [Citrobacter freundii]